MNIILLGIWEYLPPLPSVCVWPQMATSHHPPLPGSRADSGELGSATSYRPEQLVTCCALSMPGRKPLNGHASLRYSMAQYVLHTVDTVLQQSLPASHSSSSEAPNSLQSVLGRLLSSLSSPPFPFTRFPSISSRVLVLPAPSPKPGPFSASPPIQFPSPSKY